MNNYAQHNHIPSAPIRPQWVDYPSTNLIGNYLREQDEPSYQGILVPSWAVYLLSLPFTLTMAQLLLASVTGGSALVSAINRNPLGYVVGIVLMSVVGQLIYRKLVSHRRRISGPYAVCSAALATLGSWLLTISAFGWWYIAQTMMTR